MKLFITLCLLCISFLFFELTNASQNFFISLIQSPILFVTPPISDAQTNGFLNCTSGVCTATTTACPAGEVQTGLCGVPAAYAFCCLKTCPVQNYGCYWTSPPYNTCYSGNIEQICTHQNSDCSTYQYINAYGTNNNCAGPHDCRGGVCIPWCNTGNQYTACNADGRVGANTTCYTNNADKNCTYTAYTGGGTCDRTACPNIPCTFNSCNLPVYECLGGGPRCTQYFTISGTITDVDGNGTPSIPVSGAGCSSAGGAWIFGYGCKIKAGGYTVSEALPANYIPIGATAQGVTVGPNKTGVNFQVARVFSISGTITDVDGNGTPAIPVTCAGHTTSGGAFTFPYSDHIRRGSYTCSIALPANYIPMGPTSIAVTVGPDRTGVNFSVARVFSISGTITDVDGNGTPAIPVTCAGFTLSGGPFTFGYGDHIRRGSYTCSLALPANYIPMGPTSIGVTVGPDRTGVNFSVARVFSISGTITDVDGNGTPAIPVTCAGFTLSGGPFTFGYGDHIRRGNYTCTIALPANYIALSATSISFAVGPDKTGVNFNVARVFSIAGRLTDPYYLNNGIANKQVSACGYTATTDGGGNYLIPYGAHCRRGTYTVVMTVPAGWLGIGPTTQNVTVGPDQTNINFQITELFTVTGNVFDDINKDRIQDNGEPIYTGGISISASRGTVTVNGGTYTVSNIIAGPLTITYNNVPFDYQLIYPKVGPPPFYNVSVGHVSCTLDTTTGGSCNNGYISNLKFAISDSFPWYQSVCGDIRSDTGISDNLPRNAYAIITNASCADPGVGYTGDTPAFFGYKGSQVSTTQQLVGGFNYPEDFPASSALETSYAELLAKAQNASITPTDLSTVCTISNCTLTPNLAHGIYIANGNVNLNTSQLANTSNYIFLINGTLTIIGNISVPNGSTAIFATTKDIIVNGNVGSAPASTASNMDGFYVAGQNFTVNTAGYCIDQRLNIAGNIVVNASKTGGAFQNMRDLCGFDPVDPTISITQRLDMLLNAPLFLRKQVTVSQELAP